MSSSPSSLSQQRYYSATDTSDGESSSSSRRYSRATNAATISQVAVWIAIGTVMAFGAAAGWFPSPEPRDSVATRTATLWCLFSVLAFSGAGFLLQLGNELDPRAAAGTQLEPDAVLRRAASRKSMLFATLCPLLSMVATYFLVDGSADGSEEDGHEPPSLFGWFDWSLFFQLVLYTGLIHLYLHLLDEGIRYDLFRPSLNLSRLIEEFHDDSTPLTRLGVTMNSLLRGATSIVADLSKPIPAGVAARFGVEIEESRRLDQHAREFAESVVHSPSLLFSVAAPTASSRSGGTSCAEAPLEEDVLRVIILQSLVDDSDSSYGSAAAMVQNKQQQKRRAHRDFVDELVDPKSPMEGGAGLGLGKYRWHMCLPLVRALCVYVGGIGYALLTCAGKPPRSASAPNRPRLGSIIATVNFWSIPPGLYVCAEYALRAISKCIVRSMTTASGDPIPDFKSSELAILVPAALSSIFCLRRGIITFQTESRRRSPAATAASYSPSKKTDATSTPSTPEDETRSVVQSNPSCWSIIEKCDSAAKAILFCLRLPHGPAAVAQIDQLMGELLEEDCGLWVKSVVASSQTVAPRM